MADHREGVTARDEILGRVRAALGGGSGAHDVHVPRSYRTARTDAGDDMVARFVERVEDYRATLTRCAAQDVIRTVASALPTGARVVLPPELPWDVPGRREDPRAPLSAVELDEYDAVVTAGTVGIAETGTIVLTHTPSEGRRVLSLVPDLHVCVLLAEQLVSDVPQAVGLLDQPGYATRPQTWISGPSATSDIELDRVEGVHGPRTLHVVLVG